jgi:hypothetical protein
LRQSFRSVKASILLLGAALFLAHRSPACADERKELLCSNGNNKLTEYVGSELPPLPLIEKRHRHGIITP